jgi:hypothetical protein
MKMEGPNLRKLVVGVAAVVSSFGAKAENKGNNVPDLNTPTNKEYKVKGGNENFYDLPKEGGGLENKDYRIDTMQVAEKGGQQYMIIKLTKHKGEYASYQEVIDAVKKINPDMIFLTPEETENFLSQNRNTISKRSYYVALGADVTGSPIDTKASGASGVQFNTYKFDGNGTVLVAGSSGPSDNEYLFPARMNSKAQENKAESK